MRLKYIILKNFRGYRTETKVSFERLTAIVVKNEIGKSTILEALDIFFNDSKGIVKIDKSDINVDGALNGDTEIVISCIFDQLPDDIVIDVSNSTSLSDEFLLNADGCLEITKKYPNASATPKIYIHALHPTNEICSNLLCKTNSELKKILVTNGIECPDKTRNAAIRSSIWQYFKDDLQLKITDIEVSKGDVKSIWDKVAAILPKYSLFQADRRNSDSDSEIQDPLKEAVKQIMQDPTVQERLNEVSEIVERSLRDVADRTLQKIREMDPAIADSLTPTIPTGSALKWIDVFKNVTISGDENIPINKRGSGVKRLVLLNFFRAEVERKHEASSNASIIYAIEEPETSQHAANQIMLIDALIQLAERDDTQVIITTHSGFVVRALHFDNLRLITSEDKDRTISGVMAQELPYPSLNEINYSAFGEVTEEYHNELYGYIEHEGRWEEFRSGKTGIPYKKECRNKQTKRIEIKDEPRILSQYIRDQIHHPENTLNPRYTKEQLKESIMLMRDFISANM